jgi:glycosyltransferase involved in cell wall biosynthesis
MSRIVPAGEPEISVVVPLHNEAESLPVLVEEIFSALSWAGSRCEILLIDDASTDQSAIVLSRLAAEEERIRVLRLRTRSGQSAALAAGFERARGNVIVTLDADLQNDPADIPRMVDELSDCDVVCGIRQDRRDSCLRRVSSRLANRVQNRVTGGSITDVGCSLRVYRSEFVRRIPVFDGMHRFLPTLLRLNGARIKQIGVSHRPRRFGQSNYGVRNRLWQGIADLLGVRWLQARWIDRSEIEETTERARGSGEMAVGSDSPGVLPRDPAPRA